MQCWRKLFVDFCKILKNILEIFKWGKSLPFMLLQGIRKNGTDVIWLWENVALISITCSKSLKIIYYISSYLNKITSISKNISEQKKKQKNGLGIGSVLKQPPESGLVIIQECKLKRLHLFKKLRCYKTARSLAAARSIWFQIHT